MEAVAPGTDLGQLTQAQFGSAGSSRTAQGEMMHDTGSRSMSEVPEAIGPEVATTPVGGAQS